MGVSERAMRSETTMSRESAEAQPCYIYAICWSDAHKAIDSDVTSAKQKDKIMFSKRFPSVHLIIQIDGPSPNSRH